METRIVPSIPSDFLGAYMCCTVFRKSRTLGFRRRDRTWNSSHSVSNWSHRTIRIDMAKSSAARSGRIVRSSGNVFADLGFADADQRQTKVRLAVAINDVLERRGRSEEHTSELQSLRHL